MKQKILIGMFSLFFFLYLQAQNKRALVIGLGEYEDTSWSAVHGDKDVPIIVEMLKFKNWQNDV